ncbi:hypothetical protein IQ251_00700 [Saccharopolyspora sp. HNM0983]|uniref:Uncharacterized protein n=1 Tax=Saccharopolyspora montiporae TaxID=2781240 RepID=A0A929B8D4_9PSEU|nr:hypothetical protein [Saccharopolyspora sp. HNM0983]MBE9372957.1 hypothetical protein [Saccharopolyspora sp. HNM0983]
MSTGERPNTGAGGVFGCPDLDPVGTVRVHPADSAVRPDARRIIKRSDRTWTGFTGPASNAPPHEVADWPCQSLPEVAAVFEHADTTARRDRRSAVRRSVLSGPGHRLARSTPRQTTPSFWEEAKAYCRAMHSAWDLVQYWSEQHRRLAEQHRREPRGG